MKTLQEIREQRAEIAAEIKATKAKRDESEKAWANTPTRERLAYIKKTSQPDRIMRDWDAANKKIKRLEKIAAILKSNYRAALASDVVPVVTSILSKYDGKKAGEKTRQKISDELKAACGCSCFFERFYSSNESRALHISEILTHCTGEQITISAGMSAFIDEENNINGKINAADLRGDWFEYVENPEKRLDEIDENMAKLEETKKIYNELAEKINALSVGSVQYIQKIY